MSVERPVVELVIEYDVGMTVEPIQAPDLRAPEDPDTESGLLSVGSLAEARWHRLNEQDADAARRRAPVSARAHAWATTLGGPRLARLLGDVDISSLTDAECVVFAQAVIRQQSWTDMMLFDVTARFTAHRPGPDPDRSFGFPAGPGVEERIQLGGEGTGGCGSFAAAEWAAALKVSRSIATRLIADSLDLCQRLPVVRLNTRAGNGDTRRARMIADHTRHLDPATLAVVEDAIAPRLATLTARQLAQLIDTVVATHDPAAAQKSHRAGPLAPGGVHRSHR